MARLARSFSLPPPHLSTPADAGPQAPRRPGHKHEAGVHGGRPLSRSGAGLDGERTGQLGKEVACNTEVWTGVEGSEGEGALELSRGGEREEAGGERTCMHGRRSMNT